jgi:hypothetical protein
MRENLNQPDSVDRTPSEEDIVSYLETFQPHPSEDYYLRMETAPWTAPEQASSRFTDFMNWLTGMDNPFPRPGVHVALAATVLLLVIILVTLASPKLQAVAQQILHFIVPAPTDELALQVTAQPPGTQEPLNASERYPLTSIQAEELSGYPIIVFAQLPEGITLTGAQYNPNLHAVTLRYSGAGQTILFTQRPVGEITEYATVGASAPVEIVTVHGVPGEFVTGGWIVTDTNDRIQATAAPGTQFSLGVYWDPTLPQRILRWQEGNILYEILSTKTAQGITIDKDRLIKLAESIE